MLTCQVLGIALRTCMDTYKPFAASLSVRNQIVVCGWKVALQTHNSWKPSTYATLCYKKSPPDIYECIRVLIMMITKIMLTLQTLLSVSSLVTLVCITERLSNLPDNVSDVSSLTSINSIVCPI